MCWDRWHVLTRSWIRRRVVGVQGRVWDGSTPNTTLPSFYTNVSIARKPRTDPSKSGPGARACRPATKPLDRSVDRRIPSVSRQAVAPSDRSNHPTTDPIDRSIDRSIHPPNHTTPRTYAPTSHRRGFPSYPARLPSSFGPSLELSGGADAYSSTCPKLGTPMLTPVPTKSTSKVPSPLPFSSGSMAAACVGCGVGDDSIGLAWNVEWLPCRLIDRLLAGHARRGDPCACGVWG